jgi:hypothetical protein
LSDELNKEFMKAYMMYSRERTTNDLRQSVTETGEIEVRLAGIVEKLNQVTGRTSRAAHTDELHSKNDEQEINTSTEICAVDPPGVVEQLEAINVRLRQSVSALDQIVDELAQSADKSTSGPEKLEETHNECVDATTSSEEITAESVAFDSNSIVLLKKLNQSVDDLTSVASQLTQVISESDQSQ